MYRSNTNRMISGVCGGVAEFFGVDPTIVRLIWVLVALTSFGLGFIAYIIAVILIPENGYDHAQGGFNSQDAGWTSKSAINDNKLNIILGCILVLVGLLTMAKRYLRWIDFSFIWPLMLIAVGVFIIYSGWRKGR